MFSLTTHPWWRRWFGSRSERAACRFLRKLGFRILAHNFTCDLGEIDLVALDAACVVFIEVRSTAANDSRIPAESVDARKQKKLTRLAMYFRQVHRLTEHPARFDVLAISWPAAAEEPTIVHYQHAFEATE